MFFIYKTFGPVYITIISGNFPFSIDCLLVRLTAQARFHRHQRIGKGNSFSLVKFRTMSRWDDTDYLRYLKALIERSVMELKW
jgi:lipopolysaccharide/colanic/teichoic acid biosynthesis glycosyltransferase